MPSESARAPGAARGAGPRPIGGWAVAPSRVALAVAAALSIPAGCNPRRRSPAPPGAAPSCRDGRSEVVCGPRGGDCCERQLVRGGTFRRSYDGSPPCADGTHVATVSDFAMDTYEVTVARFRAFARDGRATRRAPPGAGEGAHPKIAGSGWDPAWNAMLAPDDLSLRRSLRCGPGASWTDEPGASEGLPINCVTFYEAFAFCAWDGGRLPTEAEWNYAAVGGDEQRVFPWSNPPASTAIDRRRAVFSDTGPRPVGGHSPEGDGRWGQADLAGNVWEWVVDTAEGSRLLPTEGASLCSPAGLPDPCVDCAQMGLGPARVLRGGGWGMPERGMRVALRRGAPPTAREHVFGVRCVHDVASSGAPSPAPGEPPPLRSATPDAGAVATLRVGEPVPDFEFLGFPEPGTDLSAMRPVHFRDLVRPRGSGGPARAILVQFAAAWSEDSRADAAALAERDARDAPRGGRVLLVLMEGRRHGQASDTQNLVTWLRDHQVRYPAVLDPHLAIHAALGMFPASAVLDPRTMRVVALATGRLPGPDSEFMRAYEALLAAH